MMTFDLSHLHLAVLAYFVAVAVCVRAMWQNTRQ
jgi:hypothetical protein